MIIDVLHPTPTPLLAVYSLQLGVVGKYLISDRNNNMRQCTIVNLHTWTRACVEHSSPVSALKLGVRFSITSMYFNNQSIAFKFILIIIFSRLAVIFMDSNNKQQDFRIS